MNKSLGLPLILVEITESDARKCNKNHPKSYRDEGRFVIIFSGVSKGYRYHRSLLKKKTQVHVSLQI